MLLKGLDLIVKKAELSKKNFLAEMKLKMDHSGMIRIRLNLDWLIFLL